MLLPSLESPVWSYIRYSEALSVNKGGFGLWRLTLECGHVHDVEASFGVASWICPDCSGGA